jgi:Kef-type K+ transport system membrane component KefB
MNARGAMEMILAGVALERGLIGPRLFVALVVMAVATSVISGPGMKRLLRPASPPAA